MTVLRDVVEVRPLGGKRVFLRFEDGVSGEIDLGKVNLGTIVWPNGADLAPEMLYDRVTGARNNGSSGTVEG